MTRREVLKDDVAAAGPGGGGSVCKSLFFLWNDSFKVAHSSDGAKAGLQLGVEQNHHFEPFSDSHL